MLQIKILIIEGKCGYVEGILGGIKTDGGPRDPHMTEFPT